MKITGFAQILGVGLTVCHVPTAGNSAKSTPERHHEQRPRCASLYLDEGLSPVQVTSHETTIVGVSTLPVRVGMGRTRRGSREAHRGRRVNIADKEVRLNHFVSTSGIGAMLLASHFRHYER